VCPSCNRNLDLSEFNKNKRRKDGREWQCRSCKAKKYRENREQILQNAKNNYRENREARLAQKKERHSKKREEILEQRRRAWKENPNIKRNNYNYRKRQKQKCYEILGAKCIGCGHSDPDTLVIDHVYNDGQEERKQISIIKLRNCIISSNNADGRYQLLCFNCNLKKSIKRELSKPFTGNHKICPTCKEDLDTSCFKQDIKYPDGLYYECRVCSRHRENVIKETAIIKLGQKTCQGCGNPDIDVLTVDHIHDDGHRTRIKDGIGSILYRRIINKQIDLNRFQVLCLNCNVRKHTNKVAHRPKVKKSKKKLEKTNPKVFEFSDVKIKRVDRRVPIDFLETYHYGGFGRGATATYAAYLGNEIIAVAKFSPPIRKGVATSMHLSVDEVFELDRLCIHPAFHKKNFASYFLGRVIRLVKQHFDFISTLVSFADLQFDHVGTVYKASNWEEISTTSRSYTYLDKDDNSVHKKTVWNAARSRGITEKEHAHALGLRKFYTKTKIKYAFSLR
jgi:hypothetical protein